MSAEESSTENAPAQEPSSQESSQEQAPYPPELFRRQDESDDRLFYAEPRLVVHIDYPAIGAISAYLSETLPQDAVILDLMSSWRSHMPPDMPVRRLIGLGLNAVELDENPQLTERIVHDINANPTLPLADDSLDAAVVTVSIQYMIKPVEVFAEINRALKPGAAFHVIYSNRMFPTKAVAVWQSLDDRRRAQLIASYFQNSEQNSGQNPRQNSGGWDDIRAFNITPQLPHYSDPVYVVAATKSGDAPD